MARDSDIDIERTSDGRRLVVAREVAAPRDRAWELLTDTERWPEWGPSVRAVDCPSRFIQSGTRGRVQLPLGVWLPFEITACEDYRWTWRVARVPATGHRVDDAPDGCRVCFELPVLATGYAPVCQRALGTITGLLEGLGEQRETN
jgi:hypothetical protein